MRSDKGRDGLCSCEVCIGTGIGYGQVSVSHRG